jgi:hypothetical protein
VIERDAPPHPPFPLQPLGLLEHVCSLPRGRVAE